MKKIIGLAIVAALLLAVPLAQTAMAKDHKWTLCHITDFEYDDAGDFVKATGHVVIVSLKAVPAHCENHGDHNPQPGKKAGDPCGRGSNPPATGCGP